MINLDLPWNPAVLEQRIGRAHRHGQPRTVNVINLIAQGTIEERMLDTLAAKRNIFAGVFGKEEAPARLSLQDAGQGLLKRLGELLGPPVAPILALKPQAGPVPDVKPRPLAPHEGETRDARAAEGISRPAPTLAGFAQRLLAQLDARIPLVRKTPLGDGVLVVVGGDPAGLRPAIEKALSAYFAPDIPALHLMEPEGYRAVTALFPVAPTSPEDEPYRAPALPSLAGPSGRDEKERRPRKVNEGLI